MIFTDNYKKSRPKQFNVTILDYQQRPIKKYNFVNDNIDNKSFKGNLNNKGTFLKFDFSENFGEKYFCIGRMYFYVNVTYSIENNDN